MTHVAPNISQTIFFEIFPSLIVLFEIFSRPDSFPSPIINWIDLVLDDAARRSPPSGQMCPQQQSVQETFVVAFEGAWLECEGVDLAIVSVLRGARWILGLNVRNFT